MVAPDRTLEKLFESGEFSDLIVRTSSRDFKVHKAVVCIASSWFNAACTNGFQESLIAAINLPEDAILVESILQYLYNVSPFVLKDCQQKLKAQQGPIFSHEMITCMKLMIAADKYQLPGLQTLAKSVLFEGFHALSTELEAIVSLGHHAYGQEELASSKKVLGYVANRTAVALVYSEASNPGRKNLLMSPDYALAVMDQIASVDYSTVLQIRGDLKEVRRQFED